MHRYVYACMLAYLCVYLYVDTQASIYRFVCIYIYIHIYTCMYICICTCRRCRVAHISTHPENTAALRSRGTERTAERSCQPRVAFLRVEGSRAEGLRLRGLGF